MTCWSELQGYEIFGFNYEDGGVVYREWIPAAKEVHLIGVASCFHRHHCHTRYTGVTKSDLLLGGCMQQRVHPSCGPTFAIDCSSLHGVSNI